MKTLQLKEQDKILGKVVVVWRENRKDACRVSKMQTEQGKNGEELRVYYEILNGIDKGKRFSANHDPNQEVEVYEPDEEIVAICGGE